MAKPGPNDHIALAVAGAGLIGRRHAELIAAEPGCRLAGIVDPDPDAADFAAGLNAACYAALDDLLAATKLDGLIIAVPNALHDSYALAAAGHGLHMLVEKPIADTVAAAERMTAAAEKAGVALLVGHHRRYHPVVDTTRSLIADGALGKLVAVSGVWAQRKPNDYFNAAWRRAQGGGPVLINLIHDIDLMRTVCGEIEAITAASSSAARGFAVEDTVAVIMRFSGGALGTFMLSDATASPWGWEAGSGDNPTLPYNGENSLRLMGTAGSLDFPQLRLWRYRNVNTGNWTETIYSERLQVPLVDPLGLQLRHFLRVIRGEERPKVSGDDATRTLAATQAVAEAAARQNWVVPGA